MVSNEVTLAQLMAENRHLRETVRFLNSPAEVAPGRAARHAPGAPRIGEVEEAYRLLVDHSLQGLLIFQEDQIVFANQTAADIIGLTVADLLAIGLEDFLSFIHPADRVLVQQRRADRLQGLATPTRYEFRVTDRQGRLRWMEIHAGLITYRGRPAIQVALTDVTSHKQTEQALHENEVRIRDIAASIPGAVHQFQVRADGVWEIPFLSPSAAELFERPVEDLTDIRRVADVICPADREGLQRSLEESRGTLSPWIHEFRVVTGGGRTKWIRGASRPRRQSDGSVLWNGVLLDITEHKRAEEALRESEVRLASVFRVAPVGIGLAVNRVIKDVNQSILDMTGYTREELLERDARVLYSNQEEYDYVGRDKYAQIRQCGSGAVETKWKRKDGRIIEVLLSSTPLNPEDWTAGVTFTALDITERKRAALLTTIQRDLAVRLGAIDDLRQGLHLCLQAALQASGLDSGGVYLRDETSGALDLACHTGLSEPFVQATSHYDREAGNTRLVLRGAPVYTSFATVDIPWSDIEKQERLQALAVLPIVYRRQVIGCMNVASRSLPEVPRYARTVLESLADQISGTIVRLRAEQALRESEQTARALLNSPGTAAVLLDRQGTILGLNKTLAEDLNQSPETLLGRALGEFFPPAVAEARRAALQKVLHSRRILRLEEDSAGRWFDTMVHPILGPGGEVQKVAVLAREITEQKRAQEQARQREAELLHVARVSTLGEMTAGIAHELNQPLSAIANYGDACLCLLRSATPDMARIARNLQLIVSQSERAGEILRRLRALIKKNHLQFASVDLNEVVRNVLTVVRSELAHQAVPWKLDLHEPLPRIAADSIQMEQVLLNLVRNAVEAMSDVAPADRLLTIRTRVAEGDLVQLEVGDTGVGLPAEDPQRIFEPFFTTKVDGLGLGLSISRSIVQMHKGVLAATPHPGGGSLFCVSLPAESWEGTGSPPEKTKGSGPG